MVLLIYFSYSLFSACSWFTAYPRGNYSGRRWLDDGTTITSNSSGNCISCTWRCGYLWWDFEEPVSLYVFLLEIYCYCIWALVDVCCSSHSFDIVLLGLQINDIEPFCQDEIALYKQCTQRRVRLMINCRFSFKLIIFDLRFLVFCP